MKYKTLIKRFQKYADEEVSIVAEEGCVHFFPVSDGNIEIISLVEGEEEPFKAKEEKEAVTTPVTKAVTTPLQ